MKTILRVAIHTAEGLVDGHPLCDHILCLTGPVAYRLRQDQCMMNAFHVDPGTFSSWTFPKVAVTDCLMALQFGCTHLILVCAHTCNCYSNRCYKRKMEHNNLVIATLTDRRM